MIRFIPKQGHPTCFPTGVSVFSLLFASQRGFADLICTLPCGHTHEHTRTHYIHSMRRFVFWFWFCANTLTHTHTQPHTTTHTHTFPYIAVILRQPHRKNARFPIFVWRWMYVCVCFRCMCVGSANKWQKHMYDFVFMNNFGVLESNACHFFSPDFAVRSA